MPAYIKLLFLGRINKFKTYIKYAFRNLIKDRSFSAINILGLSVGMACCILLLIFIHYELDFDSYHAKGSQIYRLCADVQIGGTEAKSSSSNAVAAEVLKNRYPEVIDTARIYWKSQVSGTINKKEFSINRLLYADPSVFNIFSWPSLHGDLNNALKNPFTMVLNETTARKIFSFKSGSGRFPSVYGKMTKC